MILRRLWLFLFVLCAAPVWAADTPGKPGVTVTNPWVRASIGVGAVTAGYVTLADGSGQGDTLTGIDVVKGGKAMLHETNFDSDVMRMRRKDTIDLPPGGKIEMSPGGLHIMITGLTQPVKAGDTFPLKLHFARQGDMVVNFLVRP
jgi:copper(I)-binding protein